MLAQFKKSTFNVRLVVICSGQINLHKLTTKTLRVTHIYMHIIVRRKVLIVCRRGKTDS